MTTDACTALSAVFGLLILTTLLEHDRVKKKHRKAWYGKTAIGGTPTVSLLGLVLVVLGVQHDGLSGGWAIFAWVLFGLSMLGLLGFILLVAYAIEPD